MRQPRPEVFSQSIEKVLGRKKVKIPDRQLDKILANQAADSGRLLDAEVPYNDTMQAGNAQSDRKLDQEIGSRKKVEARLDARRVQRQEEAVVRREAAIAKSMAEMRSAREADDAAKREEIKNKFGIE